MGLYKFNLKASLFFFIIVAAVFFAIKNTIYINGSFFLSNIAIREAFFYENNINFKGTHEPGTRRYMKLIKRNYHNLRNFNFSAMKKTYSKIKSLEIKNTDYALEYELIKTLNNLSNLTNAEKKISAIYIPKNIDTYWNVSCDKYMAPFVAPAITNIVMLDGLLLDNQVTCYGHINENGYMRYKQFNKKASLFQLKPSELCTKAKKEGLNKVIEIFEEDSVFKTKVYNCK